MAEKLEREQPRYKEHKCVVDTDGTMHFLYDDMMRPLIDNAEEAAICRISHIKTTPDCMFYADLSPINGPIGPPFKLRADAVQWEVEWANKHFVK